MNMNRRRFLAAPLCLLVPMVGVRTGPTFHQTISIGGNVTKADLAAVVEAARRGALAATEIPKEWTYANQMYRINDRVKWRNAANSAWLSAPIPRG